MFAGLLFMVAGICWMAVACLFLNDNETVAALFALFGSSVSVLAGILTFMVA